MPFNIGPGELILVLIIALIVVGPGKLPDVGAAIGKSLREFRKAATDVQDAAAAQPAAQAAPTPVAPAAPAPAAPAQEAAPVSASAPSGSADSSVS